MVDFCTAHGPCKLPYITFSALLVVRGIHRSPVNSPHKGQWRRALILPLICAWINGCANNREAGDLRRHRAHYDVTVMLHHGMFDRKIWDVFCEFKLWFTVGLCHRSSACIISRWIQLLYNNTRLYVLREGTPFLAIKSKLGIFFGNIFGPNEQDEQSML